MQALVTYPYRDRETGAVRYAGETVELCAERFRELALKGYVDGARAQEPSAEAPASNAVDDAPAAPAEMTAADLRAAIEAKGGFAPKKATKAQLAEILGTL